MPWLSAAPKLYYETIPATNTRPCLVFLHEGLGCTAMWQDFPQRLCAATGCRGLVYDRVGYGRSPLAPALHSLHYLHLAALDELPAVLAALVMPHPYILVGHSDGASIALLHASEQPSGLVGVVSIAAHVFVEAETRVGIEQAVAAYEQGKLGALSHYHGEQTDMVFQRWRNTWLSNAFQHWNIEYLLPSVRAPLLVMQGEADQYASAAQVDAIVAQSAGPAQACLLPACGHSPQRDAPQAVIAACADFINALSV